MIYMIGGAPRVGKTTLTHELSRKQQIGWVSTDALVQLLYGQDRPENQQKWDATPDTIRETAAWFYPSLERFIWSISSLTDDYVIEGVSFLPAQVAKLAESYPIRAVFLGCSNMTLDRFERYPGHSKGYAGLPDTMRRQIAHDVPLWSQFIKQEATHYGYPYIDMGNDFSIRLHDALDLLTEPSQ